MPPTGKRKPKARVARTAWAMRVVEYWEKYWEPWLPKLPLEEEPLPEE